MEKLLIRGGRVIDPANGVDQVADVLVEDGKIVAVGTPEEVVRCKKSYTGQYLAPILKRDRERMEKRKNERE